MYKVYFSEGGNIREMAMAIAEELNVKADHLKSADSLPEEATIFLGSGSCSGRPSKSIRDFIQNHDFRGRKVVLFGSSLLGIEFMAMERLLKRKGAIVVARFHGAGRLFSTGKGQTSDKELTRARVFARSVMKTNKDLYSVPDWLQQLLVIAPWREASPAK